MTDTDRRHQQIEAQFAYSDAVANVAGIIFQLNTIAQRAASIAKRLGTLPVKVPDYTTSEGPLFALTANDFEGIDLSTVHNLTHSLVLARKEMAGIEALARALGCNV
jgi:hypothetical protein